MKSGTHETFKSKIFIGCQVVAFYILAYIKYLRRVPAEGSI